MYFRRTATCDVNLRDKIIKKGDKVILSWIASKGNESVNTCYWNGKSIINSGKITTFSNYSVVSENRIIKKPKMLNMKEAVLFGCAIPTGFGMVINQVKPKKHMSVLVIGLGGIGISALLALKCINHKHVIVADISQSKLNLAKKLGFNNCVNTNKKDLKKFILTNYSCGIDICIESAGSVKTIELGFELIDSKCGKIYFASHPPDNEYIKILPHDLIKGKKIYGSWGGESHPDRDIPKFAKLIKQSKIPLEHLVPKTYKLKDINRAIKDLKKGNIFRPIIKMDHK